jgi:protoheme IX farnesyltransferase
MRSTFTHVNVSLTHQVRNVLGVFKLRIGAMIMITALVGLLVTPGDPLTVIQWLVIAIAVFLSSASAGAFNQYYEYENDRLMARTQNRAFVSGALSRSPLWLWVIASLLAGSVFTTWAVINAISALFVFLGAFFYAVVYTVWLKRRTWVNIIIGGLAGSFAVLAGAAAVDPHLGPLPLLLALVLFLWTPPHFWSLAIANQADYAAAGVPMLPVVVGPKRASQVVLISTIALVLSSLLPIWFGAGLIYLIGASMGGGYFIYKAWRLANSPSRATALGSFFASLIQLSLLLAGASLDSILR